MRKILSLTTVTLSLLFLSPALAQKKLSSKIQIPDVKGTIAFVDPSRTGMIGIHRLSNSTTTWVNVGFPLVTSVSVDSAAKSIYFSAKINSFAQSDIYRVQIDGSGFTNLSNTSSFSEAGVNLSPDGKLITYHGSTGSGVDPIMLSS